MEEGRQDTDTHKHLNYSSLQVRVTQERVVDEDLAIDRLEPIAPPLAREDGAEVLEPAADEGRLHGEVRLGVDLLSLDTEERLGLDRRDAK